MRWCGITGRPPLSTRWCRREVLSHDLTSQVRSWGRDGRSGGGVDVGDPVGVSCRGRDGRRPHPLPLPAHPAAELDGGRDRRRRRTHCRGANRARLGCARRPSTTCTRRSVAPTSAACPKPRGRRYWWTAEPHCRRRPATAECTPQSAKWSTRTAASPQRPRSRGTRATSPCSASLPRAKR